MLDTYRCVLPHPAPPLLRLLSRFAETTASIIACNINSYGGGSKLWAVEVRNLSTTNGLTITFQVTRGVLQEGVTTVFSIEHSAANNGTACSPPRVLELPRHEGFLCSGPPRLYLVLYPLFIKPTP